MKKLLPAVFCLLFVQTFSQEKKKLLQFGIKSRLIVSNLTPAYADELNSKHEYHSRKTLTAGVRLLAQPVKNFTILGECNFVNKGARESIKQEDGYSYRQPEFFTFAELTANFLYSRNTPNGNLILGGGPSLSLNPLDYIEDSKSRDMGINILAGYISNSGFSAELNFNKGFRDLKDDRPYGTPGQQKLNSFYVGLCIGYFF